MNIKLLNIFDVNLYIYDRKNNLVKDMTPYLVLLIVIAGTTPSLTKVR